jgi:hypothetical protein
VAKEKVARFGKETHPSRNSRVCWVDPNTTENPLDYEVLAFVDNDEYYLNENTVPVILHQGDWFELRYSEHSKTPYLGVQRDDIHAYDIPTSTKKARPAAATMTAPVRQKPHPMTKKQTPEVKDPQDANTRKRRTKARARPRRKPHPQTTKKSGVLRYHQKSYRSKSQERQLLAMTPISTPSEVFTPETEAAPKPVTMRPPPPPSLCRPHVYQENGQTLGDPRIS